MSDQTEDPYDSLERYAYRREQRADGGARSASARQLRRAGVEPELIDVLRGPEPVDEKSPTETWRRHMAKAGFEFTGQSGPPVLYLDPLDNQTSNDPLDSTTTLTVCEICKRPLNRLTEGPLLDGEEMWLHSQGWKEYDHEPVAIQVKRSEQQADTLCDFCGVPGHLHWAYAGQRLRLGGAEAIHDYGYVWTACAACGPYIDNGDLEGLRQHALRVSPMLQGLSRAERLEASMAWLPLWETFIPTIRTRQYIGPKREPAKLNPRLLPKLQHGLLKLWNHPSVIMAMTSPGRTHGMSLPGVHCGDEDSFKLRFNADTPIPASAARNHTQHLAAGVGVSELYWVSADFTRLATVAGKDFTEISIRREELPSTFGIMVFEEPIGEIERPGGAAAIRAASWTLVPGGIWLNLYMQGEDGDPDVDVEVMRQELGWLICPNPGSGLPFGHEIPKTEPGEYDFILTLLATWFLMAQPGVAEQSVAPVDKKLARAYQREKKPLPSVRLVDLRARPRRPSDATTAREGRKLDKRVYRRGHWKRQFYGPGRELRKRIWISPYLAGPENAPLYQKPPTVKVVR